jgi:NMDA receptor-regulated protein 1
VDRREDEMNIWRGEERRWQALVLSCQPHYTGHSINALSIFVPSAGEAYYRTKQWGPALKKFYAIQRHFQDYIDDMSDFHGFCLRKVNFSGVQTYGFVCGINETVLSWPRMPFDQLRYSYPYD